MIFFLFFVNDTCEARLTGNTVYNSQTGKRDFCTRFRTVDGTVTSVGCRDIYVSNGLLEDAGTHFILKTGTSIGSGVSMTTADTAVSTSYAYIRKAIAGTANPGFDTGTLADGANGQLMTIQITEVDTGGTWTLTPTTKTGFTSLKFEMVGDIATLLFIDATIGWIVVSNGSVQLIN